MRFPPAATLINRRASRAAAERSLMSRAELNKLMTVVMMKPKGQAAELICSNSLHGVGLNAKVLCLELEHLIFAN